MSYLNDYGSQSTMLANSSLDHERMAKMSKDSGAMGSNKKPRKPIRVGKVLLGVLIAIVALIAAALLLMTVTEYRPQDVEAVEVPNGTKQLTEGSRLTVVSYNTGYAALGAEADFFMDGGETTRPDSPDVITKYMRGIANELNLLDADIYMLQEVDTDSKRSYGMNELVYYAEALGLPYDFALNFKSFYTPYPIPDTIGKVTSGLAFYTPYKVDSAERIQLPVPFSWPISCVNLKRCLLVNRMPIEGSDKELVMVNLHLEAYDDGEGKIAQTKQLYEFLEAEYKKGNYVIAGGDFNQTFPNAKVYPAVFEDCWMAGTLEDTLPEGFGFVFGGDTPTCRLLDEPYIGDDDPMYYIIDGFIVSDNLTVNSVEVIKTDFANSDHQPVRLKVTLN